MSNIASLGTGQIGNYQSQENEILGAGNLLQGLENRVSQTLGQKDNSLGSGGVEMGSLINPQEVVSQMAEISMQHNQGTVPGMTQSLIV